eukprot:CAMPEP_0173183478 /NCGR_PEP_ID=MMETSP1141-20130122/8414_1 /TAXON_ID=483371 /ORGANISM="non described non described, Strain CCMP2298" /LENGTH=89 /DNA_ID=CAMNT_0014106685 /DNA_START=729 /DNA_END=998 /DNA_ORIENTATION=+
MASAEAWSLKMCRKPGARTSIHTYLYSPLAFLCTCLAMGGGSLALPRSAFLSFWKPRNAFSKRLFSAEGSLMPILLAVLVGLVVLAAQE